MATTLSYIEARRNARLDAGLDSLNGGTLRIYSGTPPANAEAALAGNTLLAQLTFGSPAFAAATGGTKTANAITADSNANGGATATFWRGLTSGAAVIVQGTVGATGSGESLELNSTAISAGASVSVTSLVVTEAA